MIVRTRRTLHSIGALCVAVALLVCTPTAHAQEPPEVCGAAFEVLAHAGGPLPSSYRVAVAGNIAYATLSAAGLQVLDVSDARNPVILTTLPGPARGKDLAVAGDYLFVSSQDVGLIVFDISTPAAPVKVGSVTSIAENASLALAGNTAYMTTEFGFMVIDISDPTNPQHVASTNSHGTLPTFGIDVEGDTLYVSGHGGLLRIFDVTVPAVPSLLGSYTATSILRDIVVAGNVAYVAGALDGLFALDVSNPSTPVYLGTFVPESVIEAMVVDGPLVYAYGRFDEGLYVVDMSDPTTPELVGWTIEDRRTSLGMAQAGNVLYVADSIFGTALLTHQRTLDTPIPVGSVSSPGEAIDLAVDGAEAYVAAGGAGLQALDISNPNSPSVLGGVSLPGTAYRVNVEGDVAYVGAGSAGLVTVDIQNPAAPSVLGTLNTSVAAIDVEVDGNVAYIADWTGGLQVADISNPASPVLIGGVNTPGSAEDIELAGDILYIADRTGGVQAVDISDPTAPSIVGAVPTPDVARDLAVDGNILYVADFNGGLQVVDISNPAQLQIIGSLALAGPARGVAVDGNRVLVADLSNGLQLVDVTDPTTPVLIGGASAIGFPLDVELSGFHAYMATYTGDVQVFQVADLPEAQPSSPPFLDLGPDQTLCVTEFPHVVRWDETHINDPDDDIAIVRRLFDGQSTGYSNGAFLSYTVHEPGEYLVEAFARDACGNTTPTDSVLLTVLDSAGELQLSQPGRAVVSCESLGGTVVDLQPPGLIGGCDTVLVNDAPPVFPVGDTTVTWTATDGIGNTASVEQVVTVYVCSCGCVP